MTNNPRSGALAFLIGALATYRITRLIVEDKITEDLRNKIWENYSPEQTKLGYLLTCVHCTSVWVGLGVLIAQKFAPTPARVVVDTFATAAAVSLINDLRAYGDVIE